MKFVSVLNESEKETLEDLWHASPTFRVRQRAHCILLSAQGFRIPLLARIFNVDRDTVSACLERWKAQGIASLEDEPRSGRPPKIKKEQRTELLKAIEQEPRHLRPLQAAFNVCRQTLHSVLSNAGLIWKRCRQGPSKAPDPAEVARKQAEFEELREQIKRGERQIFYFDESGFSLVPSVPYAWQKKGERIVLPSTRGPRFNVLGFLNAGNDAQFFVGEGKVNAALVAEVLESFRQKIKSPVTVVLDNAPIHTAAAVTDRIADWAKEGFHLFFTPAYYPEMNLIEHLWKKIKYDWLPLDCYRDKKSLLTALIEVLKNVGTKYQITFS